MKIMQSWNVAFHRAEWMMAICDCLNVLFSSVYPITSIRLQSICLSVYVRLAVYPRMNELKSS